MPLSLSILLLCVPPIVFCIAVGGTLVFIKRFRRGFGAYNALPASAVVVGMVLLLIHGGFFLAPVLLHLHRVKTALLLVTPVSIIATLALLWVLLRMADASERFRRLSMFAYGLMAAYLLPIIVLALNVN